MLTLTALSLGRRTLPSPSIDDAAWVLSTLCLIAAVVFRLHDLAPRRVSRLHGARRHRRRTARGGTRPGVLRVADPDAHRPRQLRHSAIVVNIGYPVLDTVLLVAAAALVTTVRLRLSRSEMLLFSGVVAFAAIDVVDFVFLAQGRWRPGSLLASLSLVATAVIATAVWSASGRGRSAPVPSGRRRSPPPSRASHSRPRWQPSPCLPLGLTDAERRPDLLCL